MHNIHELEQRWFKYKLRSYIPYIIIVVFTIILLITLFFIFDSQQSIFNEQTQKKQKIDTVKEAEKKEIPKKEIPKKEVLKHSEPKTAQHVIQSQPSNSLKLEPSLGFINNISNRTINTYESNDKYEPKTKKKPIKKKVVKKKVVKKKVVKKQTAKKKQTKVRSSKINISTRQTQDDIKNVIKRFKNNNNPALSLFVAKKYYKLGNYRKSYDYALITNNINNEIEDSWLIFAKSLVKLKKKDLAIKTLKKYIRHSRSGNAKVLLDDIKSGKFK